MTVMRRMAAILAAAVVAIMVNAGVAGAQTRVSKVFSGPKVNAGTVTYTVQNGKQVLALSPDFKVPDTPDPHWQIVDSKGRVFLLQRLPVKGLIGDRVTTSITLPGYIEDVAKVQIYCAWAEIVLGETTFDARITTVAGK